jgi:hypothetical protein
MLLYLAKHSRFDISNAVRELTKVLDGATNAHWKSLIRTIKFVLDTKLYSLRLSPFKKKAGSLFLHGYSDSEFAGDRDTHKSVFCFITFLCACVVLLYLGNPEHATVLPYHQQKLNTMLVLKQPKK